MIGVAVFEQVLRAVDFTGNSLMTLKERLEFLAAGSRLTVLHVVPGDGEGAEGSPTIAW